MDRTEAIARFVVLNPEDGETAKQKWLHLFNDFSEPPE